MSTCSAMTSDSSDSAQDLSPLFLLLTPELLKPDPSPLLPRLLRPWPVSSGLQGLALQDQLDLFGVQCLIHEQSVCQFFVLFGVRL